MDRLLADSIHDYLELTGRPAATLSVSEYLEFMSAFRQTDAHSLMQSVVNSGVPYDSQQSSSPGFQSIDADSDITHDTGTISEHEQILDARKIIKSSEVNSRDEIENHKVLESHTRSNSMSLENTTGGKTAESRNRSTVINMMRSIGC